MSGGRCISSRISSCVLHPPCPCLPCPICPEERTGSLQSRQENYIRNHRNANAQPQEHQHQREKKRKSNTEDEHWCDLSLFLLALMENPHHYKFKVKTAEPHPPSGCKGVTQEDLITLKAQIFGLIITDWFQSFQQMSSLKKWTDQLKK